ncbi:MAG: hypothetical protein HY720_25430, partial [Planctomycetes bacterium]|nr:hypothetical protein [Planctomycetota bacterium]
MDSQLPALLEKIGFLPADVARAAAAEKDPVGFCLRRLSRDGRVGQAFEALLSTDLALSVADRLPDWCRRAEEMIVAAKAGIPPDTVELARKAPSVRERRT